MNNIIILTINSDANFGYEQFINNIGSLRTIFVARSMRNIAALAIHFFRVIYTENSFHRNIFMNKFKVSRFDEKIGVIFTEF